MGFGVPKNLPGKGTSRQRHRRHAPLVPVPYAPTRKGRAAAAAAGELDRLPGRVSASGGVDRGGGGSLVDALASIATSPAGTLVGGVDNPISSTTKDILGEEASNLAEVARRKYPSILGGQAGLATIQQPLDDKSLLASATILGPVPVGGVTKGATALKAIADSERAAKEAGAATRAVKAVVGGKGIVRPAVKKAAEKAEPAIVKAAREGAAQRAVKVAEKVPAPVRAGAGVAGKTVSLPIRRPFTAPLALQAPAFIASGGDPKEFLKGLEGKGAFAAISKSLGGTAAAAIPGTAGQIANEAVNLPAVALPSVFLPAKAATEAAAGDSTEWDKLWGEYLKTGLLPAVFKGDTAAALKALKERPLYSTLEASGALSATGRGAGALARKASDGKIAGLARPDLTVEGYPNIRVQRGYSRDLVRQIAQRAYDRKTGSKIRPGTGNKLTPTLEKRGDYQFRRHVVRDAADRFHAQRQDAQRTGRTEMHEIANELLPHKKGLERLRKVGPRLTLDRASADVVVHAIERAVQNPATFTEDLNHRLADLNKIAADKHENGLPVLSKEEMKANRSQAASIEKALKNANPEHVVQAANEFIAAHQPIVQELVDRGVLSAGQAERAVLFPFARIHMGAGYGQPSAPIREGEAALQALRGHHAENPILRKTDAGWTGKLAGYRHSVEASKKELATAESGRVQAERSYAAAKAKLKYELEARKTDGRTKAGKLKGKALVRKRLEVAEKTLSDARGRVTKAKAQLRADQKLFKDLAQGELDLRRGEKAIVEEKLARLQSQPEQLIDKGGNPLSTDAILAEMKRRGVEPPGFISHRAATKGDYWAPANERASIPKGKRTGAAAVRGTYDASHEAVVRQLIRSRGLLDRIKTWDAFVTRFGRTLKQFKINSMADARRVLEDPARYGLDPNIQWAAVRRQPFTAMKSEMDAALEHQDPTIASESVLADALGFATAEHGPDGPIVFMPKEVVKNMEEHFKPLGAGLKGVQLATTGLKRAVLPFSPSYYFGNAIDNTIRTALAGVGPQHFIAGFQLSKKMDRETKDQMLGAAYSSVEKLSARRTHEDFEGTAAQGFAEAAASFRHAPGPKQFIDLVGATSHALLSINSKLTERLPQYGALGKIAMQDIRSKQGEWAAVIHLQDKYLKDVVDGLKDPDTRIRYEKGLEQIYGNWSRMSPHARKFLTNFFPFWTWSRAALKLVYVTLPAHHSIETGLLAAAARMTQEDREKLGLDLLSKEPLPNFLQGNIPLAGSVTKNLGKYTSFAYAGHPLESIATGVLPQVRDTLSAGEGRDWKGDPLGGSELSHLGTAAAGSLGTYIPGYNSVEGLLGKGAEYFNPLATEDPGALPFLRSLSESQQITVPKKGSSSSSSGPDYGSIFSGGESSVDYGSVFSGGE